MATSPSSQVKVILTDQICREEDWKRDVICMMRQLLQEPELAHFTWAVLTKFADARSCSFCDRPHITALVSTDAQAEQNRCQMIQMYPDLDENENLICLEYKLFRERERTEWRTRGRRRGCPRTSQLLYEPARWTTPVGFN